MRLPVSPEEIVRLGRQHGAVEVRLFGSFARGTADADSDLDLLVRFQPGRSLLDLVGFKQAVEVLAARRVDIVTEATLSPALRARVLAEAVALES